MDRAISDRDMMAYRAAAAARHRETRRRRDLHWHRAQAVSAEAARILRSEFSATRVVLFGSATKADHFGPASDVDIAVWGLNPNLYLKAVARLLSIDPEVSVDLIDPAEASPSLCAAIEDGGCEL